MSDVTRILERTAAGDPKAAQELLPVVYEELRRLAGQLMSLQPPGHTLQPTALVHEAWLRLAGDAAAAERPWNGRPHFFAAAAEAMRHILIDRARRRLRARHGAGAERVPAEEADIAAPARDEVLLQLDEALEQLERQSPEQAQIVKLRFYAGCDEGEIARLLDVSERTVQRQWAYAKAWLFDRIEDSKSG